MTLVDALNVAFEWSPLNKVYKKAAEVVQKSEIETQDDGKERGTMKVNNFTVTRFKNFKNQMSYFERK